MGEHDFTSIDIGRVAGQAVIDSYLEDYHYRLKVNLDEPDVIIRVDVIQDEFFIGLDTTGDDALHKRWYRVYSHPAPLNAAIAASMLRIAKWRENERLFDPMTGSGTIPIEAAMAGRNIAPSKNRVFAYSKIFNLASPPEKENKKVMEIYGMEKFRKHVEGAKENAKVARVDDTITFFQGDATKFSDIEADVIITNPPYGLRIGSKRMIEKLYNGFLSRAREILGSDGRIVVITASHKEMREAAKKNDFLIKEEIPVKYGELDAIIFKMRLQ